jgi:transposase
VNEDKEIFMGQYSIRLSQEQRQTLEKFVTTGTAAARAVTHAQVMLKADNSSSGPKWSDRQIEEAFGVSYRTILRIRQRFVEQGMQAASHRRAQPERPTRRKLDGEQEAHVIAVLCHEKPQGSEQWTLRLLASRVVELEIVESISHETVRQTLKKTR